MRKLVMPGFAVILFAASAMGAWSRESTYPMDVSVQKVKDADGRESYVLKCAGGVDVMDACEAKAQELCPRGYIVRDSNIYPGGMAVPGGVVVGRPRGIMKITCVTAAKKPEDKPEPKPPPLWE